MGNPYNAHLIICHVMFGHSTLELSSAYGRHGDCPACPSRQINAQLRPAVQWKDA